MAPVVPEYEHEASRAGAYRAKSKELRAAARRMRSSLHRINLLVLADSFEKLARRVCPASQIVRPPSVITACE